MAFFNLDTLAKSLKAQLDLAIQNSAMANTYAYLKVDKMLVSVDLVKRQIDSPTLQKGHYRLARSSDRRRCKASYAYETDVHGQSLFTLTNLANVNTGHIEGSSHVK